MASTPAVGPRPTTRTKTSAHTSSGTLRSTISSQRTAWRSQNGPRAMRPDSAETDSTRVDSSVSGTASTSASVMPGGGDGHRAPGLARHHRQELGRMRRRQEAAPGTAPVTFRLSASNSIQGRNSVATSSGHSSTRRGTGPEHAAEPGRVARGGARRPAVRAVAVLTARLIGNASPPARAAAAPARRAAVARRRAARARAGRTAAPAGRG